MEDDRPFVIESPTRIKLRPAAKEWAQQYGMSLEQMARYLLQQVYVVRAFRTVGLAI
jgi:hypothetical protein